MTSSMMLISPVLFTELSFVVSFCCMLVCLVSLLICDFFSLLLVPLFLVSESVTNVGIFMFRYISDAAYFVFRIVCTLSVL